VTNRFKVALALALLISISVPLAAKPRDVLGWQGTRWGMSETALLNAFGSKLKKLPDRQAFVWLHVDYIISDFSLDGNAYTVFFQMDDRTNKLAQVLIRLNEMETRTPRLEEFNRLERLLTPELGAPEKDDHNFDERASNFRSIEQRRTWKFHTSTVELYYGWDNQIYASLLSIRYFPTGRASTATPNKSLDASGGSVFRIMTVPAMLE
jgi:hypothetical protein